jgi:hypothetical protein
MSDTPPDKLSALGELLGVQDDTTEYERPAERRPAVGEVLRGGVAARAGDQPAPPWTTRASERPNLDAPPVRPPTGRQRRGGEDPEARPKSNRQRSSANLPIALVERLAHAKTHRWELSDLVVSALDHADLDPKRADDILTDSWTGIRVQRAYQASSQDLTRIDDMGQRWRMNRSQVLTVILPAELDRLGL